MYLDFYQLPNVLSISNITSRTGCFIASMC